MKTAPPGQGSLGIVGEEVGAEVSTAVGAGVTSVTVETVVLERVVVVAEVVDDVNVDTEEVVSVDAVVVVAEVVDDVNVDTEEVVTVDAVVVVVVVLSMHSYTVRRLKAQLLTLVKMISFWRLTSLRSQKLWEDRNAYP